MQKSLGIKILVTALLLNIVSFTDLNSASAGNEWGEQEIKAQAYANGSYQSLKEAVEAKEINQELLDKILYLVAQENTNLDKAQYISKLEGDLIPSQEGKKSALIAAAHNKINVTLSFLLKRVNFTSDEGYLVLQSAIGSKNTEIMPKLIRKFNSQLTKAQLVGLLAHAAGQGDKEILETILRTNFRQAQLDVADIKIALNNPYKSQAITQILQKALTLAIEKETTKNP